MPRRIHPVAALAALLLITVADTRADTRPNVLLIVCDDLNDWVEPLGGHPQASTPNLARFAETAVSFSNAHSNTPVCAPSRASFLTGIYPHTSGNLFWDKWYENETLANSKTLMRFFRDNGYTVVGAGKLMHHARKGEWDEFGFGADYGPVPFDGEKRVGHPSIPPPFSGIGPIDGSFGPLSDVPFAGSGNPEAGWANSWWRDERRFRYEGPDDRDPMPDEIVANWAVSRLEEFAQSSDGGPFLLAAGFIRPHTPMHVPREFFDLFPLDDVELPPLLTGDAGDTHFSDHYTPEQKGRRYHRWIAESYGSSDEGIRRFTQAYLASVAFVDAQIGKVLGALERTGLDESTVVVITSDHGFSIGEKDYLFKNTLWEESVRVPMFIRAPGVSEAGGIATRAVALIDVYPTLVDLCGLTGDTRKNELGAALDGCSLRSLLRAPSRGAWDGPPAALTMIHANEDATRSYTPEERADPGAQHWSVRTERHRYIRYNDGSVELYDHRADPHEWRNLAADPGHAETLERLDAVLRRMLEPVTLIR